jgi:hypothetical protein
MQAAVRQVDLVDRHVDAAPGDFAGVRDNLFVVVGLSLVKSILGEPCYLSADGPDATPSRFLMIDWPTARPKGRFRKLRIFCEGGPNGAMFWPKLPRQAHDTFASLADPTIGPRCT